MQSRAENGNVGMELSYRCGDLSLTLSTHVGLRFKSLNPLELVDAISAEGRLSSYKPSRRTVI